MRSSPACAEVLRRSAHSACGELILLWIVVIIAAVPLYVAWAVFVAMARHAAAAGKGWKLWGYFVAVGLVSAAAGSFDGDLRVWPGVVFAILGLGAFGFVGHERRRFEKAKALIQTHATEIAIHRAQLLTRGNYGVVDRKCWDQEITRFVNTVITPAIGPASPFSRLWTQLRDEIESAAASVQPQVAFNHEATPIEYENLVADTLRRHGWEAVTTKASGDQGVDVLATKGALRVVLQCKLYARPVGNAAVQQAIAGQRFASATHAAVVSNAAFTRAAQQLAAKASVLLLHHEELPVLEQRLGAGAWAVLDIDAREGRLSP